MPHIHELIDYTAEIFIVHQNKVLIRLHDKYNIWTCPGGHVELDETPQAAAIREAKEETGLDVKLYTGHQIFDQSSERQKELIPPMYMNIHRVGNLDHHHISLVYFGYSETTEVVPEQKSDASNDWRRMSLKDLNEAEDMEEHVVVYASKALELFQK